MGKIKVKELKIPVKMGLINDMLKIKEGKKWGRVFMF